MIELPSGRSVDVYSWCRVIEPGAWDQIDNLAHHPLVKHIAIMPDCHQGYGMPVGGVIGCEGGVIPNAVGVDIGCGMIASQLDYDPAALTKETIEKILHSIDRDIPMGFSRHGRGVGGAWDGWLEMPVNSVLYDNIDSARCQLGTLGGGNHFIELQAGDDDHLWVMIHSGSRNIGYKVANHYHNKAKELCVRWHVDLPDEDLAFLPVGEPAFHSYISAMEWCLEFAKENRKKMMGVVLKHINHYLGTGPVQEVHNHHNFARLEHHMGRDLWVHRKGATPAGEGIDGIIPGSMGTSSYIVKGKGDVLSLRSCSHGAGRLMGRNDFNRRTTVTEADASMEGIVFSGWSKNRKGDGLDLSEAPGAYKDIDDVIAQQSDLVDVKVKLRPLGVLKG